MENGLDDEPLYDPGLLKRICWESRKANYRDGVSPTNPGENLNLRPLTIADYDRGFTELLTHLTRVGDVSKKSFVERFEAMKSCPNTYYVTVIEDTACDQVIGAASLIMEQKFIHSASMRGRIEDVVVNSKYRGMQLGKILVEALSLLGKELGCYKMSLECQPDNVPFYEAVGYKADGQHAMTVRYKE